jgi:hypothetical protein
VVGGRGGRNCEREREGVGELIFLGVKLEYNVFFNFFFLN